MELYDRICYELTNYEQGEGEKRTTEEWLETFYRLLVDVQTALEFVGNL